MAANIPSSSASPIPPNSSAVYVGRLDPDVTEAHLFHAFSEFKSLEYVRLCVCLDAATRKSRRYAHVYFASPLDAEMAIKVKNHSKLNEKEILVMWSHRGTGNLSVENLGDSNDNGTNSSIQASQSQQLSGIPPSGEDKCRRMPQRLRRRLSFSTPEQQSSLLRMEIKHAVGKLKPELSQTTTTKIARKIMEIDREEVLGLLETPDSLAAKIEQVVEALRLPNEPLPQRIITAELIFSSKQEDWLGLTICAAPFTGALEKTLEHCGIKILLSSANISIFWCPSTRINFMVKDHIQIQRKEEEEAVQLIPVDGPQLVE